MLEMPTLEQVVRNLVSEAQTDAVDLWAVLWEVKESQPWLEPDRAKQATLAVIREGLAGNQVLAG
jgi:hypothetical protein